MNIDSLSRCSLRRQSGTADGRTPGGIRAVAEPPAPTASCVDELSWGLSLTDLSPKRTEPNPLLMLWLIASVVWAALMFYLSTATFGEGMSRGLLTRALAFVHLTLSPAAFARVHVVCRKLAHLIEYGIFALLLYRCFPIPGAVGGRRQRAFLCVLAAAAYSLTDEFHQLFVPGRHATVADCAIDSVGAAMAMLLVFAYRRFVSYREEQEGGLA